MNQLINYLDRCLKYAKLWDDPRASYNQAYGAATLYIELFPDNKTADAVCKLWDDVYRPQFEKIIYGG